MSNKSHPMVGGESYPPLQIAEGSVPTGPDSTIAVDWSQLTNAPVDDVGASISGANMYTKAQADAAFETLTAAALLAPINDPVFTGNPEAPTASPGDNSTSIATTAFVTAAIAAAGGGGGGGATFSTVVCTTPFAGTNVSGVLTATSTGTVTIDGHLTALGDVVLFVDQATAADNGLYSVTTAGATGVAAVFTRVSTLNTSTQISAGVVITVWDGTTYGGTQWLLPPGTYTINSTGLVITIVDGAYYAPLASPALTGNPTAPTQTAGDNSTKLATTAFVSTALGTANVKYLLGTPDVPPGTAKTVDDEFTASSLNVKWTWVNQTPSSQPTAAISFDGVTNATITRAANSTGNHYISLIGQPISNVSASPWSVTAKLSISEPMHSSGSPTSIASNGGFGLCLYESATGKVVIIGLEMGNGYAVTAYTGLTSVSQASNTVATGTAQGIWLTDYVYARVSLSGSTYYCWISKNGRSWQSITSFSLTTHFTTAADTIGIAIDNTNTMMAGMVDWFRDTTSIQAP